MNLKNLKIFSRSLCFILVVLVVLPELARCEDHWYCEPQEHVEMRDWNNIMRSLATRNSVSISATTTAEFPTPQAFDGIS